MVEKENLLDQLILKLTECKDQNTVSFVEITEKDVRFLCEKVLNIFKSQPVLLEINSPIYVCGDLHGQYYDLLRLFECGGSVPSSNYLFLGDYVDRGRQSLETICYLFCLKIKYPNNIHLLRGNHETSSVSRMYGFYDECKRRLSVKSWKIFCDVFNYMPISAIINQKIICMHGGLAYEMNKISQIKEILRPTEVPDEGILCDLLWSDPSEDLPTEWGPNERGVSYTFSKDVVDKFLKENDLELICRGHQVVEDGYEFFANKKLVTIFSAPNYTGEFDNSGGMMGITEDLICSFHILRPLSEKAIKTNKKKMRYVN